jgi:hypothetical protein
LTDALPQVIVSKDSQDVNCTDPNVTIFVAWCSFIKCLLIKYNPAREKFDITELFTYQTKNTYFDGFALVKIKKGQSTLHVV